MGHKEPTRKQIINSKPCKKKREANLHGDPTSACETDFWRFSPMEKNPHIELGKLKVKEKKKKNTDPHL